MNKFTLFVLQCALTLVCLRTLQACTTTGVTPGAAGGKVFASHSNDGDWVSDSRLFRVPNMTYEAGSMRPVYPYIGDYPRYVGNSRGTNNYQVGKTRTKPMGISLKFPIPMVFMTDILAS